MRSASDNPTACIIDCGGTAVNPHRGFSFTQGEGASTVVEGLTVRNGYESVDGGAISIVGATPTLRNLVLSSNHADNGGAVRVTGAPLTMTDCSFISNLANQLGGNGGAISCQGTVQLRNCLFRSNIATFNEKYGGGSGGAVNCIDGVIEDCLFEENFGGTNGGGVSGSTEVRRCRFSGNQAVFYGGGAISYPASVADCVFDGNLGGFGGALVVGSSPVTNCLFQDNTSHEGGGIACIDATQVSYCTFYGNSSDAARGGGIYVSNGTTPHVDHTIVSFSSQGSAVYCQGATSAPIFSCCDIFGNNDGDWTGCIAGQSGTSGNLSAEPAFCNPAGDDFSLAADSPCLNAPGCGLIGAFGQGCGLTSAVGSPVQERTTWGRVKSELRRER